LYELAESEKQDFRKKHFADCSCSVLTVVRIEDYGWKGVTIGFSGTSVRFKDVVRSPS
jgi:hypothetical protein